MAPFLLPHTRHAWRASTQLITAWHLSAGLLFKLVSWPGSGRSQLGASVPGVLRDVG